MEHVTEECAAIRGEMEGETSGSVSALREARQLEVDIATSKAAFVEALNRCAAQEARLREMIRPFEAHQAETRSQLDQVRAPTCTLYLYCACTCTCSGIFTSISVYPYCTLLVTYKRTVLSTRNTYQLLAA